MALSIGQSPTMLSTATGDGHHVKRAKNKMTLAELRERCHPRELTLGLEALKAIHHRIVGWPRVPGLGTMLYTNKATGESVLKVMLSSIRGVASGIFQMELRDWPKWNTLAVRFLFKKSAPLPSLESMMTLVPNTLKQTDSVEALVGKLSSLTYVRCLVPQPEATKRMEMQWDYTVQTHIAKFLENDLKRIEAIKEDWGEIHVAEWRVDSNARLVLELDYTYDEFESVEELLPFLHRLIMAAALSRANAVVQEKA
jgi:hypothetical protein